VGASTGTAGAGTGLSEQLHERAADPGLRDDLHRLAGGTIDELA